MKLPKIAIEHHQFTIILITLLVLIGVVSYITMPRSEDPQISPPGSSIIVIYPGATPQDVEEQIVEPIEEAVNELEDIKRLKSLCDDDLALITVEFTTGSDADEKYSDVVQKVNSVRSKLPQAVSSLDIEKWTISEVNILELALYSDSVEYGDLEEAGDELKRMIELVPGVKGVKLWAYPEQQVRIAVSLDRLAAYHLSLNQVINAIQAANQNIPGGTIDLGDRRFNVRTSGSFSTLNDLKNTVINARGGQILYLKDVADVRFDYEDREYFAKYQGKKALLITATQKPGTNIFQVRDGVEEKISAFKKALPAGIDLGIVFDQQRSVAQRMDTFTSNLLQGLILVGLVVFLAIGRQAALIVILAIPFSIFIAIGFVDFSGYGIQQMTIAGLVIALGLLVDNAIVVIENIVRYMKTGMSPRESAITGTNEIGWAIVSSTATTVLAFIPMMMMMNVTGDFIRSMPVTVVYTLSASLLLSLMLTPYLSSRLLKAGKILQVNAIRRKMNRFVEGPYRRALAFALRRPKLIISAAFAVFILSGALFPVVGISFFPKAEKPQFFINVQSPRGTSLAKTEQVADYVDSVVQHIANLDNYIINIGHGNPRIYYNVVPNRRSAGHAQFLVQLKEYEPDDFEQLLSRLRSEFSGYPGAKIEVKELEQGPPFEAPVAIRLFGDDLQTLKTIAGEVEGYIGEVSGAVNINNPLATAKTDLQVHIDRDKAALLGVPLVEIDRTVRAAIAGWQVSSLRDSKGKEFDIVMRLPFEDKLRLSDLDKIYVSSLTGAQIPLRQLASIEFASSLQIITHYNMERNVTVTADVARGTSVDEVTDHVVARLADYNWPKGYRYQIGGELESREESFGGMYQAVLIALLGIFGVLVLQFRSLSQPFIVFSAIPLALIGSILALLITGFSFSFTAFVGLASLVGIVINNSIILVDYTNQLRREGKSMKEAIAISGETRFIPIILTTATTVGGLLPLTLRGGSLWAPMGWTIIGGLTVSTLLTLIVVPVLYQMYTSKNNICELC